MARKKRSYVQIGETVQPEMIETVKAEAAADNRIPAALYARLSKADIATGKDSMENQLLLLRTFAEKIAEIRVVKELIDDGFTGTNFRRPLFSPSMMP